MRNRSTPSGRAAHRSAKYVPGYWDEVDRVERRTRASRRSEWLAALPYATGQVSMWGTSYGAHTQADAAKLDEYSEVNIEFHQAIIRLSRNAVLIDLAENLFTHMRMIRRKT